MPTIISSCNQRTLNVFGSARTPGMNYNLLNYPRFRMKEFHYWHCTSFWIYTVFFHIRPSALWERLGNSKGTCKGVLVGSSTVTKLHYHIPKREIGRGGQEVALFACAVFMTPWTIISFSFCSITFAINPYEQEIEDGLWRLNISPESVQ